MRWLLETAKEGDEDLDGERGSDVGNALRNKIGSGVVAHTCNPSTSGG